MALHTGSSQPLRVPHSNPLIGLANPAVGDEVALPEIALHDDPVPADVAYQLIKDELLLDGSARLNLATFVTTWMEPQALTLMKESADKNMIDKDEYPQTAEIERRCVAILADLWHAPSPDDATGCSTTGSSEACMLAGMALKRRWEKKVRDSGGDLNVRKPNLVMGANVQVCWEKFCRYWDVEPRTVPMEGEVFHLEPAGAIAACDENTIGVVAILGSTFDGSYEPVAEISAALDKLAADGGPDIPVHVDGASGAMIAPFLDPDLLWDFRLERVSSINTSGHKYGLVYPGVGWVLWRDKAHLPEELVFNVNYLGGNMPTFALNFSRPGRRGRRAVLQLLPARPQGLHRRAAGVPRRRDVAVRADRQPAGVPADHQGRRAAGVRLHHLGHGEGLGRLRRLPAAARTRLAGARRTPSRSTGRIWPCCGWCAATGSRSTWPTCSSRTCWPRSTT